MSISLDVPPLTPTQPNPAPSPPYPQPLPPPPPLVHTPKPSLPTVIDTHTLHWTQPSPCDPSTFAAGFQGRPYFDFSTEQKRRSVCGHPSVTAPSLKGAFSPCQVQLLFHRLLLLAPVWAHFSLSILIPLCFLREQNGHLQISAQKRDHFCYISFRISPQQSHRFGQWKLALVQFLPQCINCCWFNDIRIPLGKKGYLQ